MARRRMFSLDITDTDRFAEMPTQAQALYYNLGMHADDDGFIGNTKRLMLTFGHKQEDLNDLIEKGYVVLFSTGVVAIVHWREQNTIPADRYKKTLYIAEKQMFDKMHTECKQPVAALDTQYSIVECSIVKSSRVECSKEQGSETQTKDRFEKFWQAYPRKIKKHDTYVAFEQLNPDDELVDKILEVIRYFRTTELWQEDNGRYIPGPDKFLSERRWEDVDVPKTTNEHYVLDNESETAEDRLAGRMVPFRRVVNE